MSNLSWGSWTARVSSHIKFKPDRAGVEEELLAHLEDKAAVLLRGGMTVAVAETRALTEMGDADEVGRALAAVHKPWLGYLWLWSRRAVILCAVVLILSLFGAGGRLPPLIPEEEDLSVREWYMEDEHYRVTALSPQCRDESDGFTFTVSQAVLVENEAYTAVYEAEGKTCTDEVEAGRALYLAVESRWLLPRTDGCSAFRHFYAVDDLGNVYPGFFERSGTGDETNLVGNYGQSGLWSSVYEAWISRVDPAAGWVELRYDRDGRDVRLRVPLTGGDGA